MKKRAKYGSKAWKKRQTLLGRALQSLHGYANYGSTLKATLFIGRSAGLDLGKYSGGDKISVKAVARTVLSLRAKQVDGAAGATVTVTKGYYKGASEPSTKVEIAYTGKPETPSQFKKRIAKLAQKTAAKLAQREVIVEMVERGKTTTSSASPTDAPNPDSDKFCE